MAVRARIEKLLPPSTASFIYQVRRAPIGPYWHYHPEYQITLVRRGEGKRFVGDDVARFKAGDLVLTGPNLPHMWVASRAGPHEALIIQFPASIFGGRFLELPEMAAVRRLLERSAQGLRFGEAARRKVASRVIGLGRRRGLARLIGLLEILRELSQAPAEGMSSRAWAPDVGFFDRERIDRICRHARENAGRPLPLSRAAAAAHMSVPAFTRFFRRCSGKSFGEYLAELRIGTACRLLLETDRSISEIRAAAGFRNLSNFNRRFRALKGVSPREFRAQYSS